VDRLPQPDFGRLVLGADFNAGRAPQNGSVKVRNALTGDSGEILARELVVSHRQPIHPRGLLSVEMIMQSAILFKLDVADRSAAPQLLESRCPSWPVQDRPRRIKMMIAY
jgi:hypothetical protein